MTTRKTWTLFANRFLPLLAAHHLCFKRSNWIRNINKLMINAKAARQIVAKCLHTKTFSSVMPTGEVSNARLTSKMNCLLGNLSAEIDARTRFDRLLKRILSSPGAPSYSADRLIRRSICMRTTCRWMLIPSLATMHNWQSDLGSRPRVVLANKTWVGMASALLKASLS